MRGGPMPAGGAAEGPAPFLRPTHPQRRRRRSLLARVAVRIVRVVPALLVPLAAWLWIDGTTFALADVETAGSPRIPADWIEGALAPELGSNLLSLPLDRVRERLEAHPWLGRIEARKELPDKLHVVVEERVAAAVLETAEGLLYVDASGRRIAPLGLGDGAGRLLRIAAGSTPTGISPALATGETPSVRRALELERELLAEPIPDWSVPLLWLEVVGDDDFRLYAGELPFSILVRSEGSAERLRLLERLRPEILEHVEAIAEIDLRFESRVIVRPRAPEPKGPRSARERTGSAGPAGAAEPMESTRSTVWDPQPKET